MIFNYFFSSQLIAQSINNPALGEFGNMNPGAFFGGLISALLSLGLVIGAIVFLFYFILGGIGWISSGGDKMKLEQAKSRIANALIGIVVLLSFVAILNLVECFFGIGLRQVSVGPFSISFTSQLNCGGGGGGDGATTCGPTEQTCYNNLGESFCWPAGEPCPI